MNACFMLIKPDAVSDGNVGRIVTELENAGFSLVKMKTMYMGRELADSLYQEHRSRDTYQGLLDFMTDGLSVALVVSHHSGNSVGLLNELKPWLRGRFGNSETVYHNAVHISDSTINALRETVLFFN